MAANGADVAAVTVSQNLYTIVAHVRNNKVPINVKRDTSIAMRAEVAWCASFSADDAQLSAITHPKHSDTRVVVVKNSYVAFAVDCDAGRTKSFSNLL